MDSSSGKFFGKYRGTVINNVDPMRKGRVQVQVADVHGSTPSTWAMPCLPVAGLQSGFSVVPPIGAGVWVEFEQGDADYPIWVGGFWGEAAELPALASTVPPALFGFVLQTTLQNGMVISDTPIYIQNGKGASITLLGASVAINETALVVT
jgi:uncharacterized protein involved in type VI secretion and phage assembly